MELFDEARIKSNDRVYEEWKAYIELRKKYRD